MSTELTQMCGGFPSLEVLKDFSTLIAKSGMVPPDYVNKPEAVAVAIMFGYEIGLKPLQAIQNVAVIKGRPSVWGDAALALVRSQPDFEDIEETDDGEEATCIVYRKGRKPVKRTFSNKEAAEANLLNNPVWKGYKKRMRQMRARGYALRDSYADVLKGIVIAEEAIDMPQEREINPGVYDDNKDALKTIIEKNKSNQESQVAIEHDAGAINTEIPQEPEFEEVEEYKEPSVFDVVMNSIFHAKDNGELLQSMKLMRQLTDEEKTKAGVAYNKKQAELKGAQK